MAQFKLSSFDPDEGLASITLASGEGAYISIGRLSAEKLNVRVLKKGWFGIPGGSLWHLCLTSSQRSDALGNIVYYDPSEHDPVMLMIGYCSTFDSIAALKKAHGSHATLFDADKAYSRLLELGICRRKEGA